MDVKLRAITRPRGYHNQKMTKIVRMNALPYKIAEERYPIIKIRVAIIFNIA